MLNDPQSMIHLHALEVDRDNLAEIVVIAEEIIEHGLTNVIRFAHPPGSRESLGKMEGLYSEALPHMRETVERAYSIKSASNRLRVLNPLFIPLRPAPMLEKPVYNSVCHSRLHRSHLLKLMGQFQPAPILRDLVAGYHLSRV